MRPGFRPGAAAIGDACQQPECLGHYRELPRAQREAFGLTPSKKEAPSS